ncbi:hypothetical protein Vadar_002645 [Vaccinium darrowii]|uniref:Uncharacterized protein n=1 Tax=Vaccinium darrowii TaxID=229202 RepID=A0ACB7YSL0_9ERIC|nr:hypothetical protein Vadar_002645 [Vaccinium darrowii]
MTLKLSIKVVPVLARISYKNHPIAGIYSAIKARKKFSCKMIVTLPSSSGEELKPPSAKGPTALAMSDFWQWRYLLPEFVEVQAVVKRTWVPQSKNLRSNECFLVWEQDDIAKGRGNGMRFLSKQNLLPPPLRPSLPPSPPKYSPPPALLFIFLRIGMGYSNIRGLLTSFSPSLDFFAVSSGDGRIKIWDTVEGQVQTEFAILFHPWLSLDKKRKRKLGSSLLILGTGSGDILALDVSAGQMKWRVSDCHPGFNYGKLAMEVHGFYMEIFSLSVSSDGKTLVTAAAQLNVFNCSDNKKIQKFSGHPGAVRCMIFTDDGKYILSSAVAEHAAGLSVLAISEMGICYFCQKGAAPTIFAAKLQGIAKPASGHIFLAYGLLIKPSFQKILVHSGTDIRLNSSSDGLLLPITQSSKSKQGSNKRNEVSALDRANAEDAVLPMPTFFYLRQQKKGSPYTVRLVPDSSDNVCIVNCSISTGYDAIALKSGWDEYGIAYGRPTTSVHIKQVYLQAFSCSLAFRSEMSGGISNVLVEHLYVYNSNGGVEFRTTKGRGGYIKENVTSDVGMKNVETAFSATGQSGLHPDEKFDPNALPIVDQITLQNVIGSNISLAGKFTGIQESPFTSICLPNVSLAVACYYFLGMFKCSGFFSVCVSRALP